MPQTRFIVALVSSCLIGCAGERTHGPAAEAERASTPAPSMDPLAGDYPQVMWMCNVWEVPVQSGIADDGTLYQSTSGRPNGVGVAAAGTTRRIFDSIAALPGSRHVASPALLVKPGQSGRIESGARDKAGASIGGRSLTILGTLVPGGVETELEVTNSIPGSLVACSGGRHLVPEGGALLLLCPGPDPEQPWTLVALRPSVLRSVDDYPFQRASSISMKER